MPNPPRPAAVDRRASARRRAIYRRRRITVILLVISAVALVTVLLDSTGSPTKRHPNTRSGGPTKRVEPPSPAIEAGMLPWGLDSPLSREVVVPGASGSLMVAGGLSSAQSSVTTIFSVDVTTGDETVLGHLAAGLHDAAGAVVAGQVSLFGGGSPATVASVEQFPGPVGAGIPTPAPPGWVTASATTQLSGVGVPGTAPVVITGQTTTTTAPSPVTGSVTANLPRPRSDGTAVTIGTTTYVIGGYDGTNPDSTVWRTTDGVHFAPAGTLSVPVRYGAVAAHNGQIYIFGGEAVGGPNNGSAIDSVQQYDPSTGRDRLIGALPQPLAGASAFDLGGHLYLAGGVGNSAPSTPGAVPKLSTAATNAIWAWDTNTNRALTAGTLRQPVSYAGSATTYGRGWILGGENDGQPTSAVQMIVPNPGFGTAGASGAGSPYFGYKLLIADRGNDRLLAMAPGDVIGWTYPSVYAAAPPGGFYFPDDAFFANHGTEIVSNQERNHTIVIISFPGGSLLWQYGHPLVPGSAPGYLSWPDDAYVLKDGEVTVADDMNCRILFINPDKTVANQIASTGVCTHRPPTGLAEPNGDTPLANGDYLVSEIHGQWISEYTKTGSLIWSTHLDMHYPSDPQQLGPDLYLVSDYAQSPGGAIDEFNREGQILYRLQPTSGLSRMNQPSLTELLPSGVFMTNDDYRNRMVAFDPPTGALVWQYGVADTPGTAPGYLHTPDGFDLLAPDGSTPTHPATG